MLGDSFLETVALGAVTGFGIGVITCRSEVAGPLPYATASESIRYAKCIASSTAVGAAGSGFGYGINAAGFGGLGPGAGEYIEQVNRLTPAFGCVALGIWNAFGDAQIAEIGDWNYGIADASVSFAFGCGSGLLKAK